MSDLEVAQVTDDSASSDVSTEIVDAVIAAVSDQIDSYLRNRYALPIPEGDIPPALRDAAVVMVKYRLWSRRMEDVSEGLTKDRDAALAYLMRVQRGEVILPVAVAATGGPRTILSTAPTRVFTDDTLRGFRI